MSSGHRPQRPSSIGLETSTYLVVVVCAAEQKKSEKAKINIFFFDSQVSISAVSCYCYTLGWRIFYVHVITLLLWKIFKGIATGMRFALSFNADQFSVTCVCVNPSRARAEQVSTTCWVNRPNMLSSLDRLGRFYTFFKVPKYFVWFEKMKTIHFGVFSSFFYHNI